MLSILIVDDSSFIRRVIREYIKRAERILLDWTMPEMDGKARRAPRSRQIPPRATFP